MEYTENERQYAMWIHLSQLAGFIIPAAGWIVPLVLWLTKKDTSTFIDQNGKIVMNWIISCIIYAIVCSVMIFLLIGIPLLVALAVCGLIFTIVGALRAKEGILWPYPLSIPFLK